MLGLASGATERSAFWAFQNMSVCVTCNRLNVFVVVLRPLCECVCVCVCACVCVCVCVQNNDSAVITFA